MPSPHVDVRTEGAVRIVSFRRPEKRNALTVEMYQTLVEAMRGVDLDDSIRVLLLTGTEGVFTAGNDLGDFMNNPPSGEDNILLQLLFQLVDQKKPLMVAVDGPAVGIGTTLLLHADYVAASSRARFQMPFINLALCPEGGSSLLLSRVVGSARAAEWLMFGEPVSAAQARDAGLVNAVVAPEELSAFALERAQTLSKKPLGSLLATKELLRGPSRAEVKEAILREAKEFLERLSSPEAAEAFAAFFSKKSA